ncbi:hypothetical protein [Candidatus Nitrososphaera gargensis]|uniref:hypothetical protein n=1 Tax=Candidatus Nitrososphaera gargensis TaxID=497727 RepID=UPI00165040B6|nr:hypothetical protein [Candidatus Nitrososphaera gargensis]
MPWHIVFFYGTVIAGSALGLGCLAAGIYFEFLRGRRQKRLLPLTAEKKMPAG